MGDKKMNFLQLIDIDWLRFLIPALGFVAFGFAGGGSGDDDDDDKDKNKDKDDDDTDDDDDLDVDKDKDKDDEKKYGQKYVTELREEAKRYRIKMKELETEKKEREDKKLKDDGEHEKRADKIESESKEKEVKLIKRMKISELKAEAKSQGVIDPDIIEIIKLDSVDMDDDFKVTNAKEIIEEFKEKHPKLFDDNEDEDDRDPEDNKKPGRKDKANRDDFDKMSSQELLEAGFPGDKKTKKKKH